MRPFAFAVISEATSSEVQAVLVQFAGAFQWRIQGGVQGVQTPALLFRCFFKRIYFENMSLRFLAEQGAS